MDGAEIHEGGVIDLAAPDGVSVGELHQRVCRVEESPAVSGGDAADVLGAVDGKAVVFPGGGGKDDAAGFVGDGEASAEFLPEFFGEIGGGELRVGSAGADGDRGVQVEGFAAEVNA